MKEYKISKNDTTKAIGKDNNEIITKFNDTRTEYPRESCIVELFEEQVLESPCHVVIRDIDKDMTYAKLDDLSSSIAAYLLEAGIREGDIVGISTEKKIETVAGFLGILKIGGV